MIEFSEVNLEKLSEAKAAIDDLRKGARQGATNAARDNDSARIYFWHSQEDVLRNINIQLSQFRKNVRG
jgi:hypothetical protein